MQLKRITRQSTMRAQVRAGRRKAAPVILIVRDMKISNKLYFWLPLFMAMLLGLITGASYEFMNAFPTADWAAKGEPFFDRWLARQSWFLKGFFPGAIIGVIVGLILYFVKFREK